MVALHHSPLAAKTVRDIGPTDAAARLHVRDIGPADAPLVDRLHNSLSRRSQYQRFHAAKPRLSPGELRFLAGADGRDHVALIAMERGEPIAIARYVRLKDRPDAADIAAEVVDDRQRQGLGTGLIRRLARRAAASGVERFTATVLSETGLRASLARRGWHVTAVDGPTTTLEADVWRLL
jgi:GNAT superfamily N-acetyltransferase